MAAKKKKTGTKKSAAKKKTGGRKKSPAKKKYGAKATKKVGRALHQEKRGKLKSGSGRKVKSRKQAIAIGLSEARAAGGKVPPKKKVGRKKKVARKKKS